MTIFLTIGAGIILSFITKICKKYGADPRIALYFFACLMAVAYTAFTTFVPGEVATQITTFVLTALGSAAVMYNFFLKEK